LNKKLCATICFLCDFIVFGLWLDYQWRKLGWNTNDVTKNYFTPDSFEASVRKGLEAADEYVWVYTEQPRWWSSAGTPVNLPQPYLKAIERARKSKERQ
jgi:hypothetical protein